MVLAMAMAAVALACAGEEPTAAPAATSAPAATATSAPAPTAAAEAEGETEAVAEAEATATPVPEVATVSKFGDFGAGVQEAFASPGYQERWGTPVYGGTIRMRHPWPASSFHPNMHWVFHSGHGTPIHYATLAEFDPWVGKDRINPRVAESWEIAGDGLTYTFKLRDGITYQDNPNSTAPSVYQGGQIKGDKMTCEDVAASLEFHVRPPDSEPRMITYGASSMGHVNSVTCPDGDLGLTAVLHLDWAKAATMGWIAEGGFVIHDKDWLNFYNTEHPGLMNKGTKDAMMIASSAGPWMPLDFTPDIVMKMQKNPNYYLEGLPFADEWHLVYINDFATAFTALATGQVHVFGACSGTMQPGQVLQAERDFRDTIKVTSSRHASGQGTTINKRVAPFDDHRVNVAINLATDRQGWWQFKNISELGAGLSYSGYYPSDLPGHWTQEEIQTWPGVGGATKEADIVEANRLLDEVFGAGKRFTAHLEPSNQANYIDIALYMADTLTESLGIDFTVQVNEPAVSRQRAAAGLKALNPSTGGVRTWFGDADGSFKHWTPSFGSAGTIKNLQDDWANRSTFFDKLFSDITAQSEELDPAKRALLVKDIDYRIHQEYIPGWLLGWNVLFYGEVPGIAGVMTPDFTVVLGAGLFERMWLTGETKYSADGYARD